MADQLIDDARDLPPLQAGMNNDELRAAWQSKLPRIAPSDEQLTAFALGAEIGWSRAVAFVRAAAAHRWSQRASAPEHWKAYPGWESMARAVEWLADDMEGGKQREAFDAGRPSVLADRALRGDGKGEVAPEDDEAEFELIVNDCYEASASGPRAEAWREIQHYAAQYAEDGAVTIWEVIRKSVPLPAALRSLGGKQ